MTEPSAAPDGGLSGQTVCGDDMRTPWRDFLRTETGSAIFLLAAVLAALAWANIGPGSYEEFWGTHLSLELGTHGVSLDLREWVNSGLMTLFFFVVGLEARREFDMGELRERRRVTLPFIVGIAGMAVPVAIFLAINSGRDSVHGWGAAMSTDTAFALGMLALLGSRLPTSLRAFILTVTVVDDFVALGVIAVAYSDRIAVAPLLVALGVFGALLPLRAAGVDRGPVYALFGIATWTALLKSGVDPVVTGLALGLLMYAYPAARSDLERASGLFRLFREQPTPELARSVRQGLASALSPNERLQRNVRYVWRHLPLKDVHPRAQLAGEASEAAAAQGAFWPMHDLLLERQDALKAPDLVRYAAELGLDVERFERNLRNRAGATRVAADVESADLSGVSGTPTFFVNGVRHHGAYDVGHLSSAVRTARARVAIQRQ